VPTSAQEARQGFLARCVASSALTAPTHEELPEAVVQLRDVSGHPHRRTVRMAEPLRPCSTGGSSGLDGTTGVARDHGAPPADRGVSVVIRVTNTTRGGPGCAVIGATMHFMTSASLTIISTLLCGCSLMGPSKPEAQDMGEGRYSVTGTTISTNIMSARQDAAAQANAFCGSSSRQAVIENFDDLVHGGHWGGPTSSAVFYCR
jgi:hypothetical protein